MVLESMKRSLLPLLIYRTSAPHLSHELRTYADELERLYAQLSAMFPERFLSTATDRGLVEYEEMFGPARDDLDAQERRERLRLRMSLGEGDFTPAGIRKALDSFGLEYVISEFPTLDRLNIEAQTDYSKAEQAFISREVSKTVPAHLEFQLVFNTLTWNELDARTKTFSALDNDNLMWEEIDSLE